MPPDLPPGRPLGLPSHWLPRAPLEPLDLPVGLPRSLATGLSASISHRACRTADSSSRHRIRQLRETCPGPVQRNDPCQPRSLPENNGVGCAAEGAARSRSNNGATLMGGPVVEDVRRRPTLPPRPRAVPSALKGLTSGFGMGPGVSLFAIAAETLCGRNRCSGSIAHPPYCVVWWICMGTAEQWTRSSWLRFVKSSAY